MRIQRRISAHLIGLGVTPTAVIPISARDGDGARRTTPRLGWYGADRGPEALDAPNPPRPLELRALRLRAGDLQFRRPPHRCGSDRLLPFSGRALQDFA